MTTTIELTVAELCALLEPVLPHASRADTLPVFTAVPPLELWGEDIPAVADAKPAMKTGVTP